ncbi:hypothetical protein R3W88_003405 [Solanum pinnatisectum]|uniref:Uncharacterized protein n=1 Tax=Solanum pinnatisectum TaxID=50273 RepID=A0AAV9MPM7_9SOLN|nr:hypothetical protein R3W88_003405 [Solanum pinnatisectum]
MSDEISSRFQGEHTITKTLMDYKIAAMEQRLIKELLGIDSTKPTTHKPESNSAQTTSRSTIPSTKGNTPPTYNGTNNPLIRAHRCEHFFEKNQHTMIAKKIGVRFGPHESSNLMGKLVMLQQTDRVEIYQCQLQAKAGIG